MAEINALLDAVSDKVNETQALGISSLREIDLLAWLRAAGCLAARAESQAALYRMHFLMRNALYQLARDDEGHFWTFSPIGVEWVERIEHLACDVQFTSLDVGQAKDSSLENYYLDIANLSLTDHAVDDLLQGFWRRYQAHTGGICTDISAALNVLGLERVESMAELKAQYRRLVMRVHPDRGGSKDDMQRLNSAFNRVKNSFIF